jgi:hypothetical protein
MSNLPLGSWIQSAKDYKVVNNVLHADLHDIFGFWHHKKIFIEFNKYYDNNNGSFYKHTINNHINYNNKWCILLTTAIGMNNEDEINFRKKLYIQQINKWLNKTNYFIFIVESTGNGYFFNDIKNQNNNRIDIISLNLEKDTSSSILEAKSIKGAMNYILKTNIGKDCTHILKVTGRYFLNSIQYALENITQNADVYIQIHTNHNDKWQNTEYYGIKKELLIPMVENVIHNRIPMEHAFYLFINRSGIKINTLGPFDNDIRRGGDNTLYKKL